MDTERKRRFFSGHWKWALPLAALAVYMANPVLGVALGVAAAVMLGTLWLSDRRAAAAYGVSHVSDGASATGAPSKQEVMRCWIMMF